MIASALDRRRALARLGERYDILVIGGGATGVGTALDAVTRGYATALVEAADFASATSSRSTKLVHGGVRYLQQGNVALVREALAERARLFRNAPHLVDELAFILPVYSALALPYYAAGLASYDLLAGAANLTRSRALGRRGTLARLPGLRAKRLAGSVRYADAQFDDARLALAVVRTAAARGATVANYVRAESLTKTGGRVDGAILRDRETGDEHRIRARVVVNATGIFADDLRRADEPGATPLLTHSRGSHLVFPREILGGEDALIVPRTPDGRVLFAIPWYGHIVVGTTDLPAPGAALDVAPTVAEIDYLVETVNGYLERPVRRTDALAAFAGLRPLVTGNAGASTAQLSREHLVATSPSGLVTVTGGKWTTYRKMAQDAVDVAARTGSLRSARCVTADLPLHGATGAARAHLNRPIDPDAIYGSDAADVRELEAAEPSLRTPLAGRLPYRESHVVYAIRSEMARTVDDVLSRRTRARFLDEAAARSAEPRVAALLARERARADASDHA